MMNEQDQETQDIQEQDPAKQDSPKKKSSAVPMWIFASLCFLFLIFGLSSWLSSRSAPAQKQKAQDIQSRSVTLTNVGFDTPVTFQAECSESDFVSYLDIVKNTFKQCNELFDQYNEYEGVNNIYTLNHTKPGVAVEVDPRIIECIKLSMDANAINEKFDISEGRLLSLWHDVRESDNPQVPDHADILTAKEHTGMSGIEVDGNTISFTDDTVQVDLGAIAKGYTAGLVKKELEAAGLEHGYINAGGNVVLIGTKMNNTPWKIGIQKPDTNDSLVRFTTDTPTCLVTSGDYQRYVDIDGTRYSHIIDPKTGYPASYVRSVTVIHEDSAWSDAMSTALFCMSVEDGLQVCQEQKLDAVWFTDHGAYDLEPNLSTEEFDIYYTPGLEGKISLVKAKS